MKINWLCIFSVCLILGSSQLYGQEQIDNWENFPADSSIKTLQTFKDIFKSKAAENLNDDEKTAFLKKGIAAATTLEATDEIISFSQMLGEHYNAIDSFSQAISAFEVPIDIAPDTITIARAYNRLGYMYFTVGDYRKSLEHYFKSVKYGKLLHKGWETYPYGNITNVYKHLEDYEKAIEYTKASIAIDEQATFPEREYGLVYNYTNLLIFNDANNQPDSCLYYIDLIEENIEAIDTIESETYQSAIFYARTVIAKFYIDQNAPEIARKYLNLAKANKDERNPTGWLEAEGLYYIRMGQYEKAKSIIQQFEDLDVQNFGDVERLQNLKIEYYTAIGNFRQVAQVQEERLRTQKEKFGNDRLRYSAFAYAEFKNLEQQQRIANLENQQKLDQLASRNRNYVFLIMFLIIAGIATFWWYRNQKNKKLNDYLDEQVRIKTQDLEQANYELRTFNYIASHDIKEPIRNIGNYANLIFRQLPKDVVPKLERYFDIISKSTRQLYTLIEDFAHYTALSKGNTIALQTFSLNEQVETLEHNLSETLNKYRGKIVYNNLPVIHSNASLLYIILKNLIENGLKFNDADVPTVKLSHFATDTYDNIIVQDNGIGIKEEHAEKIFEMFTRLHGRAEYEGSGIGLAIVKLLSKKLGAKIILNSSPGQGSTVTIRLPKQ